MEPNETAIIQKSFLDIPWYFMNRRLFINALNVGYLLRNLDKGIDEESNPYQHYGVEPVRDIPTFQYIYSKFEALLGEDFMDQWYGRQTDEASFNMAWGLIDNKYGVGTFAKLYKNIEVILCNRVGYSNEPLSDIAMIYSGINDTIVPMTNPKLILQLNTEVCNIVNSNPRDISKATAELEALTASSLYSVSVSGPSK